jgi:hypothetical protein
MNFWVQPPICVLWVIWVSHVATRPCTGPLSAGSWSWDPHRISGYELTPALRYRIWSRVTWGRPKTKGQALSTNCPTYGLNLRRLVTWNVIYPRAGARPQPFTTLTKTLFKFKYKKGCIHNKYYLWGGQLAQPCPSTCSVGRSRVRLPSTPTTFI